MSKKDEALKLALETLKQIDEAMPFPVAKLAQKVIREALAEQPAQQQVFPACRGMNCGCTDGTSHSPECQAEHAAAIAGGVFVKTARQQEPLTDAQIIKLWSDAPNDTIDLMAFKAAVRFAEAAHNIKEKNT